MKRLKTLILQGFLCMAIVLTVVGSAHPVEAKAAQADRITVSGKVHHDYEEEVFRLLNAERKKEGLTALKRYAEFQTLAEKRAAETFLMFSHLRPDGNAYFQIVPEGVNYEALGENIAAGQGSPKAVMNAWMHSPDHRGNILQKSFTHVGIGCFEKNGQLYWVQFFVGTQDRIPNQWDKDGHGKSFSTTAPITYETIAKEGYASSYQLKASERKMRPNETGKVQVKLYGDQTHLGTLSGANVKATSNSKDIVQVEKNGTLLAKKEGTATLKIQWGSSGPRCTQKVVVKCTHEDKDKDFLCDHCQKPMKPSTPKLKSVANKQEGVLLTWEASKYAKNYNVYRKLPKEKSWTYLKTVKETTYLDTTVKNNETYLYTVKAKNGDAKSGYDAKGIQIVRIATPVLSRVENVSGGVKVSWKKVTGATTYNVYRKANGANKWTTIVRKVKGTSYIDKDVEHNGTYVYTVRAVKNNQLSYYDTKGIGGTYLAVPKVTVKNTVGGVSLSWKAIPGATGYKVYHKAAGDSKWTVLAANHAGTSWKDTTVVNGKEYTFAVRALKETERSYYKGVSIVHVSTPTLCDATQEKKGIKVRWKKVAGATSYRVYRKEAGEKSWNMIAKSVDGLSYLDQKVTSGHTYVYTVKAFKGKTYSGNSSKGVSCTYQK